MPEGESRLSYELMEEGYERVFDEIDIHVAEDPFFQNRDVFLDVVLVDDVKYIGKQHVNVRERDEDVYEIVSPSEYCRRIFLYEQSRVERLADQLVDNMRDAFGTAKERNKTTYFVSPEPRTNLIDTPQRGDVMITVHERFRGFPITSFLVHQTTDVPGQCEQGLERIKRSWR